MFKIFLFGRSLRSLHAFQTFSKMFFEVFSKFFRKFFRSFPQVRVHWMSWCRLSTALLAGGRAPWGSMLENHDRENTENHNTLKKHMKICYKYVINML